jgi:hypothetical protein
MADGTLKLFDFGLVASTPRPPVLRTPRIAPPSPSGDTPRQEREREPRKDPPLSSFISSTFFFLFFFILILIIFVLLLIIIIIIIIDNHHFILILISTSSSATSFTSSLLLFCLLPLVSLCIKPTIAPPLPLLPSLTCVAAQQRSSTFPFPQLRVQSR